MSATDQRSPNHSLSLPCLDVAAISYPGTGLANQAVHRRPDSGQGKSRGSLRIAVEAALARHVEVAAIGISQRLWLPVTWPIAMQKVVGSNPINLGFSLGVDR
jgi:hypothetical protein